MENGELKKKGLERNSSLISIAENGSITIKAGNIYLAGEKIGILQKEEVKGDETPKLKLFQFDTGSKTFSVESDFQLKRGDFLLKKGVFDSKNLKVT